MIIAYASDLHLEFGSDTIIEKLQQLDADVLILAGDIADTPTWKAVDNINSEKGATLRLILEIASQSFTATFIVMGNHEHYKGTFQKTSKYIRNVLPDNVYLLDNSTKEIDGVVFAGTTMWTEMAAHNPIIRNQIHMGMNDFRHIRYMKGGNYAKFTPSLAHQEYIKANNFIMNLPKDKPVVMITHHSPTNYSIPVQYQTSKMNDAYYSKDMESTLEDGVFKPVLWVHGHCLTEDTEILTRQGWKSLHEVDIGDHVYSVNNSTLKVEDDSILDTFSKYYTGTMISLKGKGLDIRVTDKHRIPKINRTGITYIEANELLKRRSLSILKAGFMHKSGLNISDDLIRLYILLVADGSLTPAKLCRVLLKKERKILKVRSLLTSIGLEFKELHNKSGTRFHFRLPLELENFNIKGLDEKILDFNKSQVDVVRETYSWTDGSRNLIFTSKKEEVDLLQHMFIINGFSCTVLKRVGHGFSKGASYQLSVTERQVMQLWEVDERTEKDFVKDELVWCITNKNSNFFCRRNGKVMLTGNCHNKIQTKFANIPILCNPRGYQGYESIADTFEFELEEI